ncbi:phenylalanine--tRNA ligase subunit beta [Candidatus Saccharibacteria bacterium]|nr:phenylalanine--tRNA ligase subunit beta [Candidatus Saccharibacteria bacterium]
MKISLNWIKEYVKIPVSDEELISLIGSRLVEVEGVIDETHKYDDIYIVQVEKVEKIPETHLSLCQINVGGAELVQVVCGAPNVREGMLAVWIKPGATVPVSVHEDAPSVLGTRKMLGKYESNGMLAGADELDFGGEHLGIAEIEPGTAKPGDLLADVFNLRDLVLEIENKSLTHRPDCFGIIGFSREVAGILGQKFDEPEFLYHEMVFPEGELVRGKDCIYSKNSDIQVQISDSSLCPRYSLALLKVNDATDENEYLSKVQIMLAKAGMMTISRVVDVTNYLMLLTGQPLHAFDYDKFLEVGGSETAKVTVRLAKEGEKLELLDGEVVECIPSDILITSNDIPVALAGAMGGKNTEIDETTKNVLLESASFSLYNLRKTQMAHGIFSEAITRFTKGVPAGGTFNVLAEAVREINGRFLGLRDSFPGLGEPSVVMIAVSEINGLLGTEYKKELIVKTLENVGFSIQANGEELTVIAPYWRTDIHIKEDVIEEIGRLLGYDNIAPILPLHATAGEDKMFGLKRKIREALARFGANEVLTYSFISERLLKKAGEDVGNSYKIVNSISPELQYIRQSLIPSLLEKTYMNEKMPVEKFAIFEMNEVYRKEYGLDKDGVPEGRIKLGFIVAERKNITETAFYKAKKYLEEMLKLLGIRVDYIPVKSTESDYKMFEARRSAKIMAGEKEIGIIGEFKNSVRNEFKLAPFLAGFEVDLDEVLENVNYKREISFGERKKEDLTITTTKNYAEVLAEVQAKYPEAEITPSTIYQAEGQETKNITFHIETKQ